MSQAAFILAASAGRLSHRFCRRATGAVFASYWFDKPLVQVYRDTIPFFLVMLLVVLLTTYLPWLALVFS